MYCSRSLRGPRAFASPNASARRAIRRRYPPRIATPAMAAAFRDTAGPRPSDHGRGPRLDQPLKSAIAFLTSAMVGLVSVTGSPPLLGVITTVGTVRLPPLTLITNSAAAHAPLGR